MQVRRIAAVIGATALLSAAAACGQTGSASGSADDYPKGPISMTAPTEPGSGFDLTIRTLAQVLEKERIVTSPLTLQNRPGGLTTTYMNAMVEQYKGDDDKLSVASTSTVLLDVEKRSKHSLADVTMLGSLMLEQFAVATSADAPYDDLDSMFKELAKDPSAFPVAAPLEDSLVFILLAEEAGVDASKIKFVAYEGGGEQATAVLNGDVKVAVAGVSELKPLMTGGDLKGLAVVSEKPLPGLDIKTSTDQGYKTTLANWRLIYGPPNMPKYAVDYWTKALKEATSSKTWATVAKRNQWTTAFKTGAELESFVADTKAQIQAVADSLGRPIIP